MKTIYTICFFAFLTCSFTSCQEAKSVHNEEQLAEESFLHESKEDFDKRMEWWRDDKFGMFIHWGPYAVPAGIYKGKEVEGIGEWIMNNGKIPVEEYETYARQFNPVQYDADRWVQIARDAGIKYIVITSKHHDGFALWNSKVSEYDVMDFSPIKRDLLGELKKACDKYDVKLCFYHSIMDWHHPDAQGPHYPDYNTDKKKNPDFDRYVSSYLKPQLAELVEKYDPYLLWFDGEWIPEWTHEHGVELYSYLRKMKPDLIINNRVDKGRNGMQGMNEAGGKFVGDFGTPEQEILEGTSEFDWESCMTMNDTWGFKKNDHNWKSSSTLIHNLVDVAAKGGNYLLNVGPTAEGLIPEPSVERLLAMGEWLKHNGEAIYKTEKLQHHFKQGENIRYTRRKGEEVYYGIALQQPKKTINFKHLKPKEGSKVYLLGYDKPLNWKFDEAQRLTIDVPAAATKDKKLSHAWVFKVEGEELI
jgi:alpha-L-fucosidase